MMRVFSFLFVAFAMVVAHASAQQVRTGFTSDTVRVGDVLGVAMQVDLPAGAELVVPDTLELSGDLENAARKHVRIDTLSNGMLRHSIAYPIAIWRPGKFALPRVAVTVRDQRGERSISVKWADVNVTSVLPADTTNVEAKPPRDAWGANRLWWPLLLLVLAALAAVAALIWWMRRRQSTIEEPVAPVVPAIPPREWALRELQRIAKAGWLERGEYRPYYIALSETLRQYVGMLDSDWSTDLTTYELNQQMLASQAHADTLSGILERADLVKFARHEPGRERPRIDFDAARLWVETFEKPRVLQEAA
jgi:hypothetical protein